MLKVCLRTCDDKEYRFEDILDFIFEEDQFLLFPAMGFHSWIAFDLDKIKYFHIWEKQ